MSTNRREILSELSQLLNQARQEQGGEHDIEAILADTESSMTLEEMAMPRFFLHQLPILLRQYPDLELGARDSQEAEDRAINELKEVIRQRLVDAYQRRGQGEAEARESADRALNDPRARREVDLNSEIGTLHTALRAIECDGNLGGYFTDHYLNGREFIAYRSEHGSRYQITYRRALAIIWKGASEPATEFQVTLDYDGMSAQEARELSIGQVIAELANNRREHNLDPGQDPRNPMDRQTCNVGFRSRVLRMLQYNDRYMNTRRGYHFELLLPKIHQAMETVFERLSSQDKKNMLTFFNARIVDLDELDEIQEEQGALIELVERFKQNVSIEAFNQIVGFSEARFRQIRECLTTFEQQDQGHKVIEFYEILRRFIDTEVSTLDQHVDRLNATTLKSMISKGLVALLSSASTEEISASHQQLDKLKQQLDVGLKALRRLIEETKIRAAVSADYRDSARYQQKCYGLRQRLMCYKALCDEYTQKLEENRQQREDILRQTGLSQQLDSEERDRMIQVDAVTLDTLRDARAEIDGLEQHLADKQIQPRYMTKTTKALLSATQQQEPRLPLSELNSPKRLAEYVWSLLNLKDESSEHYVIKVGSHADMLTKLLDTIFGDGKGLRSRSPGFYIAFVYAFNQCFYQQLERDKPRWHIVQARVMQQYNIDIGTPEYSAEPPSEQRVYTFNDILSHVYQRSSEDWKEVMPSQYKSLYSSIHSGYMVDEGYVDFYRSASLIMRHIDENGERMDRAEVMQHFSAWCSTALSIWRNYQGSIQEKVSVLTDFVVLTLMRNLGVYDIPLEAKEALEKIVQTYLHIKTSYTNKLWFYQHACFEGDDITNIKHLACHLRALITTLKPKNVRDYFAAGKVLLGSRAEAELILDEHLPESMTDIQTKVSGNIDRLNETEEMLVTAASRGPNPEHDVKALRQQYEINRAQVLRAHAPGYVFRVSIGAPWQLALTRYSFDQSERCLKKDNFKLAQSTPDRKRTYIEIGLLDPKVGKRIEGYVLYQKNDLDCWQGCPHYGQPLALPVSVPAMSVPAMPEPGPDHRARTIATSPFAFHVTSGGGTAAGLEQESRMAYRATTEPEAEEKEPLSPRIRQA